MEYYNSHTHKAVDKNEILNVFLDEKNLKKIDCSASIGLHPWHIEKVDFSEIDNLLDLAAKNQNILAIGETGLDKIINTDFNLQKKVFEIHLEAAEKYNLPLIIHCVKSYNELIKMKKKQNSSIPWVFHGFNNKIQIADELIKHNCFISFGAALINNNSNAKKILNDIPLQNILFETDDSDIKIEEIYKSASSILEIELQELTEIIKCNFLKCFGERIL